MAKAQKADAVIFGAVGGPKWDKVPYAMRPEAGLLRLRKDLDLFANLRPAICYPALADASSLKRELVEGLDIMIVRELTGGVYFGEPKEIVTLENGEKRAVDTQVYTTHEIERIAKVAFDLARKRGNKVHSAEKRNVMRTGVLWNEVVTATHKSYAPDVKLEHILADNCAMQLVRNPKQFDVIVTDNLFGDVLSDEAAMATGSLGMLPSASLGAPDAKTGKRKALYEPVHGSAPDIAGKGLANPIATIASFGMALRYSFDMGKEADLIDKAIAGVLAAGLAHRRHHAAGHAARSAPPRWAGRSSTSSRSSPPKSADSTAGRPLSDTPCAGRRPRVSEPAYAACAAGFGKIGSENGLQGRRRRRHGQRGPRNAERPRRARVSRRRGVRHRLAPLARHRGLLRRQDAQVPGPRDSSISPRLDFCLMSAGSARLQGVVARRSAPRAAS